MEMKNRVLKLSLCSLALGTILAGAGVVPAGAAEAGLETEIVAETEAAAEAEADTETEAGGEAASDVVGTMAFAQCEEYINVRSAAGTDSEIVAKIYNNGSATILAQEGDWYKIQSGNAEGYVKAEYFATGDEAEAIAQQAAYNVAVVHPDELNVRVSPSEDTEVIDVAYSSQELEVVAYEGDWMKVALGNDVYGYVNAYYVEYKTYYPQAETVEEEQARLEAEAYEESSWEDAGETSEDTYAEEAPAEDTWQDSETVYDEAETVATEATYSDGTTSGTDTSYVETETVYTEADTTYEAETVYTEADTTYETEPVYTETETAYTEPAYTETETAYTEPVYSETEASSSGTGQQIVDYATQFIGNPYEWGGTSLTDGADCSGFVQSVFANYGIGLARTAADQSYGGTSVSLDSIQPGDLLFYSSSGSIDHVAIYAGNGTIVHAANANSGITTSSYNYSTPVSAVRYW